jgi:hypothetical protein
LHPEALGKPLVFGNCQAGWHALGLNPLRLGYTLLSDKNLFMQGVAPLAAYAREKRVSISADNPFLTMQQ